MTRTGVSDTALGGLSVVDLSWGFAGGLASMVLADYGADVVAVEPPGGDPVRDHPAFPMWFRGKRSAVLDARDPTNLEHIRELCARADVVIDSLRPGVGERLGLDYAHLSTRNPGLVQASVTAFGPKGPYAHLKGYEGIAMAKLGGYRSDSRLAPREGPTYAAVPWASYGAAQDLLHGILAALYVRERTGVGQHVRATLAQGMYAQDPWGGMVMYLAEKFPDAFQETPHIPDGDAPVSGYVFRLLVAMTRDGHWLQFSQTSPHLWDAMVKALEIEKALEDPEFADAPDLETFEASMRFWDLLLEKVRSKTLTEWQAHFEDHPNVGAEVFRTPEEGLDHPQLRHNRQVITLDDPVAGETTQLAPFAHLEATPAAIRGPAPALGEHTEEVLASLTEPAPAPPRADAALPRHPLEGITILEMSLFYASPYGTTLLADLGARVIKIEPMHGDEIRFAMPIPESGAMKVLQGKESVALDLGSPEGRAIVHEIAKDVDLVMMGFRGGVAERMGVDCETLRAINPDIVYLSAPGYGVEGPFARKPAYAPTIGAGIGVSRHQAGPGIQVDDPAALSLDELKGLSIRLGAGGMGPGNADGVSAQAVGTALLLGLLARQRTGRSQSMLTSMICSTAWANSAQMIRYEGKRDGPHPDPLLYGMNALYRLYPAAEGWVFVACVQSDEFAAFCAVLAESTSAASLADDPRFACSADRRRHDAALAEAIGAALATAPAAEWERRFAERDVPCVELVTEPMHRLALKHASMLENGFVDTVKHPIYGEHPRLGPLVHFSKTPGLSRPGCTIGQHTRAVLEEIGYSAERIEALAAEEKIRLG